MPAKIFISLSAIVFIFINPYLEISETHLFSVHWTEHARLHNAWQLISNACLSILTCWLVWRKNMPKLAAIITIIISASFLTGYLFRDVFNGSMSYASGEELKIMGFNPSIGLLCIIVLGLGYSIYASSSSEFTEQGY